MPTPAGAQLASEVNDLTSKTNTTSCHLQQFAIPFLLPASHNASLCVPTSTANRQSFRRLVTSADNISVGAGIQPTLYPITV